jgi:hypothetical protein
MPHAWPIRAWPSSGRTLLRSSREWGHRTGLAQHCAGRVHWLRPVPFLASFLCLISCRQICATFNLPKIVWCSKFYDSKSCVLINKILTTSSFMHIIYCY